MIRAIIIDDELPAIAALKQALITDFGSEMEIVSEFTNPLDARAIIKESKPDVIFLDIELGAFNGFEFLEAISPFSFEVIFVTGYNEYAIKAFRYYALDYLLKPIETKTLGDAFTRLKGKLAMKSLAEANNVQVEMLLNQVNHNRKEKQVILKHNNEAIVVLISDIVYIEAHGSYSFVFFRNESGLKRVLMSYSIAEYEEIFDKHYFFRIHKSYLINCTLVEKINKTETPNLNLKLAGNLPISRRRMKEFIAFIKG